MAILEKYMQKVTFLTKSNNGSTYFCVRPEYTFSKLEFDLRYAANRLTPVILLGEEPNDVQLDEQGREWYSSASIYDGIQLKHKILTDMNWFFSLLQQRIDIFSRIKVEIAVMIDEFKTQRTTFAILADLFRRSIDVFTTGFPYAAMALTVDQPLIDEFRSLLLEVSEPSEVNSYFASLFISDYVQNAVRARVNPLQGGKLMKFPPEPLLQFVEGRILTVTSNKDGEFFERFACRDFPLKSKAIDFATLRTVCPIVFQLGQENPHVFVPLARLWNHLAYSTGQLLVQSGSIQQESDILNLSTAEILSLISS
jgi:hypothetical protein